MNWQTTDKNDTKNKKGRYLVNCVVCNYCGNKGKLVKSKKIAKSISRADELIDFRTNDKWYNPNGSSEEDNSVSWSIRCPKCDSIQLIYM